MSTIPISEIQNYVGANLGASEWIKIDQARVNSFAEVTGDFQFIHLDEEAASKTPFGGTIAHGFLTLSLVASMGPQKSLVLEGWQMGVNYGSDKVRFLHPVRVLENAYGPIGNCFLSSRRQRQTTCSNTK